jgi:hypothetical protein
MRRRDRVNTPTPADPIQPDVNDAPAVGADGTPPESAPPQVERQAVEPTPTTVHKFVVRDGKLYTEPMTPAELTAAFPPAPLPPRAGGGVTLVPGGFEYGGRRHDLTGRPVAMLQALLRSHHHSLTAEQLRVQMAVDDEAVDNPDQVIRDTARKLRHALREAIREAGLTCPDPLPSTDSGARLAYRLAIP